MVEPDRVADDVGWESISVIAGRLGSSSAYSATRRLNMTIPMVLQMRYLQVHRDTDEDKKEETVKITALLEASGQ